MRIFALGILVTALMTGPTATATPVVAAAPLGDGSERAATTERVALSTIKKRVIALTNQKRVSRGCGRVRNHAALGRAAQKHSKRMAAAENLSHQLPGEPGLRTRYRIEGYNPSWWGENIAWNQRSASAVVRSWWRSAPHRRNILNCRYKHVGIGYALDDDGEPYWTQDFGRK